MIDNILYVLENHFFTFTIQKMKYEHQVIQILFIIINTMSLLMDGINENYFISKCRIPMTELRSITGLDINGELNFHIVNEFYKIIPQTITPEMIENTLININGDNAMVQYIALHNIDITKRMRSSPNTYRILTQLSHKKFPKTDRHSGKYTALTNLFHPILYYLCNKIIHDYCAD